MFILILKIAEMFRFQSDGVHGYKQLFKTTIHLHIQTERLNKARLLLKEGKWDVGEVDQMVGYTNKSHFASKFKEKFGIQPKQFQKSF